PMAQASPVSPVSAQSPASPQSVVLPVSAQSPVSPISVDSPASGDSHDIVDTPCRAHPPNRRAAFVPLAFVPPAFGQGEGGPTALPWGRRQCRSREPPPARRLLVESACPLPPASASRRREGPSPLAYGSGGRSAVPLGTAVVRDASNDRFWWMPDT